MNNIPLKPEKERFTDGQWQAVHDGGDNLLISASAGSGKTAVLVRRVIEKLRNGSNIDELLIVTFTEAAAREMKERLQEDLQKMINQESNAELRAQYAKQLVLLPSANISTLHSFCLTVIRRFYFLIDMDPVFRMLTDETEKAILWDEVWEALREEKYASGSEVFYQLTENFSRDRDDRGLTSLVENLFSFANASPDPDKWLASLKESYRIEGDIGATSLFQEQLKPLLLADLELIVSQYQQWLAVIDDEPKLEKNRELFTYEQAQFQRLLTALNQNEVQAFYDQLAGLDLSKKYSAVQKNEISKGLSAARADFKKTGLKRITEKFPYPPAQMKELMEKAAPLIEEAAELTGEFMRRFQAEKFARGVLDFSDLEHYTLQILQGPEKKGSEASNYYRSKFEEILVDEYQDVNRLQEAILFWTRNVIEGQGNMFMVGDVKQSIYAFRLADPTLFIEKYQSFGVENGGRRIILAENFRSRAEVLEFTNLVFQQLMDQRVGQIDYDKEAELIPGFPNFPESEAFDTELLIYEKESSEDTEDYDTKVEGELKMTALKIRELVDQGFEIYDKELKHTRPVNFSDIVLLIPTRSNNLDLMAVMKQYQIPIEISEAENYFQAIEIQVMVSVLKIIDNPYLDIPLAAVLRSPVVGLDENDLAEIRAIDKKADYYFLDLLKYRVSGENHELKQKVGAFLERLDNWRDFSKKQPLSALLWKIYEDSAYLDYVLGLPAGRQRYANLLALVDRSQAYEKSSFRGLYQFIRFIEKMQEKDKDLAEPVSQTVENAVRIMTIHGSKGLEFPIVFLMDMSKRFNNQDFTKNYIFEERLGAGIKYLDSERRVLYDTLPYIAIKQAKLRKAYSEEMRKLYVALTRAEQKLFLVGSYKDQESTFKAWRTALNEAKLVLNPSLRMNGTNLMMNWVGMTLMRHPLMEQYFPESSQRQLTVNHLARFKITWSNAAEIENQSAGLLAVKMNESGDTPAEDAFLEKLPALEQRLSFKYPFEKATLTTSYQSVSEIKRIVNDPDDLTDNRAIWQGTEERQLIAANRYTLTELAKPKFTTQVCMDSHKDYAAIGTATHLVLQILPLKEQPTKESIEGLIKRLVKQKILTPELAEEVRVDNILWFFDTELGQKILTSADFVRREQPFAMLKEATEVYRDYDQVSDELLIHGIIDGFIEYPDRIILYDFKTDYFADERKDEAVERYKEQLNLYKEALEQANHKPVTEAYLIFLTKQIIESV